MMTDPYQQQRQQYGQGTGQYGGQGYQQQGYPQQAYQQPAQQGQPAPQPPSHLKLIIGISVALIAVVVVVFMIFGMDSEDDFDMQPIVTEPAQEVEIARPAVPTAPTPAPEPVPEEEFRIEKFVFADVINDDYSYTPRDNKTFFVGEKIYLYLEPAGFEKVKHEEGYSLDIIEDIEVRDPDGKIVSELTKPNFAHVTESVSGNVAIKNRIWFGGESKTGTYTFKCVLTDNLSGEQVSQEDTFDLEFMEI